MKMSFQYNVITGLNYFTDSLRNIKESRQDRRLSKKPRSRSQL